jgi:carboxypeptidase family protein
MKSTVKIVLGLAVAMLAANSTFARDNDALVIKGKVVGDDGKPAVGSEIRVKPLDKKGPDKVAVTDSRGQYIVIGLVAGNYTVTAYDSDGYARSRAVLKTQRRGWARVNFDLALSSMVGDGGNTIEGHDHMTSASSHLGPLPMLR